MSDIDKITIQLGGIERPFKIGTLGMFRAMDKGGVDVLTEFESLQGLYAGSAKSPSPTKLLAVMSRVVWAGLLSYDESITLDQVMDMMDVPVMGELSPIIGAQMTRFMQGQTAGEAKAPVKRGKVNKS